ncbi:hypothetical protein Slala03_56410 [Streptomyces lavendulae subsp. lavendulae]|nr:hypothetical protein Slala03_56410 [Streptomyces lavendulae subsp. lavendulae]
MARLATALVDGVSSAVVVHGGGGPRPAGADGCERVGPGSGMAAREAA